MSPHALRRRPRARPRYPALLLAASLGASLVACGPGSDTGFVLEQQQSLAPQQSATSQPAADAGSGPLPTDFLGGDMAYETLPEDGGVR